VIIEPKISQSIATLLLISALPLNADPAQQSIYQSMVKAYTQAHTIDKTDLDSLTEAIHTTWAARFRNIPKSKRPKCNTFYLDKPAPSKKQNVQVVQKTSAVKDKGPTPFYSSQQQTGSSQNKGKAPARDPALPSAMSNDDKKKKNRRAPHRPNACNTIEGVSDNDDGPRFKLIKSTIHHPNSLLNCIASPAPNFSLGDYLPHDIPPPANTSHSVASFNKGSRLTIRTAKEQKPWKAPRNAPYPIFHKAKSLAECIGAMLTIQTTKNLEGVVKGALGDKAHEVKTPTEEKGDDAEHRNIERRYLRSTGKSWSATNPGYDIMDYHRDNYPTDTESMVSDRDDDIGFSRANMPEPAPVSSSSADMDINPFVTPPASPIAPWIETGWSITPDPAPKSSWLWGPSYEAPEYQCSYEEEVDHNTDWAYVPSLPLRINIVLIDPSTAEQVVDSSIIACICKVKIDLNSSNLFTECAACEHKAETEQNGTIKWIMDSGASMAFTSMTSDFSNLIYIKQNKQPAVATANGIASILGGLVDPPSEMPKSGYVRPKKAIPRKTYFPHLRESSINLHELNGLIDGCMSFLSPFESLVEIGSGCTIVGKLKNEQTLFINGCLK